jgi:hypothetical protein
MFPGAAEPSANRHRILQEKTEAIEENELPADHADKRGLDASESASISEIRGKNSWSN